MKTFHFARILFLCCFVFTGINAQTQSKPSAVQTYAHDSLKVKDLSNKMLNSVEGSPEKQAYNEQIKALAEKNLAKKGLTRKEKILWKNSLAQYYTYHAAFLSQSDPKQALANVEKALGLYLENKNYNEVGMSWISKGFCYIYLQNFPEAINSCFKGLKYLRKDATGEAGVAYANSGLGYIYTRLDNYPKAVLHYTQALVHMEKNKNPSPGEMIDLENINSQLGNAYLDMKQYGQAEAHFLKALTYSRPNGDSEAISAGLVSLGNIKVYQKEFPKAKAYFSEALSIAQTDLRKANAYNGMGEMYITQRQYAQAVPILKQAVAIAQKNHSLFVEQRGQKLLYEALKGTGQFEKSLTAYEAYSKMVDSSRLADSKGVLKEQQLQYEFEKKELLAQMKQQEKISALRQANEKQNARRNLFLYVSIGVALLLLAGIVFFYQYSKQRNIINANKNNELQQKLLLTQMNPHFIFNSISNIQGLIHKKQDQEAVNYLTKFSKLTRQILENSRENFIPLSEEIQMLENYLSIQKLLYNQKFTYTIDIAGDIDPETLLVPPMLTQPFIENAIKHGLANTDDGGRITVRYYKKGQALYFEVVDNGSGLAPAADKEHKSLSTEITRERLFRVADNVIEIHTLDLAATDRQLQGVKTFFEIPYLLNS